MMNVAYRSTKTFCHSLGLSCAFRQHGASSHCNMIHGYALQVKVTFEADGLDDKNWVVDFGGLKEVKGWLEKNFDHKLLVADDDPELELFQDMDGVVADCRFVPKVGCEAFASEIFDYMTWWIDARINRHRSDDGPRVRLVEVEVREHEGNSASIVAR